MKARVRIVTLRPRTSSHHMNRTARSFNANAGSFDYWLTERYCLYAALKPGRIVYGEVHHPPWPLQPASVELRTNTMTEQIGITLPDRSPVCHFARYQEVVAWPILPLTD